MKSSPRLSLLRSRHCEIDNRGKAAMPDKKKQGSKDLETKQNIVRILDLMSKEMGESADSPEWDEFREALGRFESGEDINGAALSGFLLQNLKEFTTGKKNFIRSAKGQEIAQRAAQQLAREPEIAKHPIFVPLVQHFHAVTREADMQRVEHLKYDEKTLKGWVIVSDDEEFSRGKNEQKEDQKEGQKDDPEKTDGSEKTADQTPAGPTPIR